MHAKQSSRDSLVKPVIEHRQSEREVAEDVGCVINWDDIDRSKGLDQSLHELRLQEEGLNALTPPKKQHVIFSFLKNCRQLFNLMLLVSGLLSFILYAIDHSDPTNLALGIILLVVVALNAAIETYQKFKTESILEGFLTLVPLECRILQDGRIFTINSTELVRGDLVAVSEGQKVPADLRIIKCSRELKVDNSSLTGESEPQERKPTMSTHDNPLEASNLLFSGTLLVCGEALGIVIRTGDSSILGQIAKLTIQGKQRKSQLEREINIFVRKIAIVAVLTGVVFFIYGVVMKLGVGVTFSFAIGLFSAFVPQGLPATVTMLLALSAKRMATRNVLVKDLHAVETLGSITLLASDKTGTLTQSKMSVVATWLGQAFWPISAEVDMAVLQQECPIILELLKGCVLCSRAQSHKTDGGDQEFLGDATEVGLLKFAMSTGMKVDALRQETPKVHEVPFSSVNKWHLTIHRVSSSDLLVLIKGAPERVLSKCRFYRDQKGNFCPIDQAFESSFQNANKLLAETGKRVLAFAHVVVPSTDLERWQNMEHAEIGGLTFIGLAGLMDPPKKGVRKAIAALRAAGIQVVMVTGDQPMTGESIARQVGLIQGCTKTMAAVKYGKPEENIADHEYEAVVIHGDDLCNYSDGDWDAALMKKEIVFARTSPKQKLEIVTRFQAKGHVVGVSGDGVNDAPALKKADLGISMNKTASDVSKEAANMILLDDNFVSIVAGVSEGRLIFSNLKKSIR